MTDTHPEKRFIGYARVSSYGQPLDAQPEQLRPAGCGSRNIYRERVTRARADRRQLLKMLKALASGTDRRPTFHRRHCVTSRSLDRQSQISTSLTDVTFRSGSSPSVLFNYKLEVH